MSSRPTASTGAPAEVVHGGIDREELRAFGLRPEEVIDFSVNVNPLGPPPAVREVLASLDPSTYPDPQCRELRQAVARQLGVGPDNILAGNGSTDLIHVLARALLRPGERCLLFAPTFGEYEAAARLAGARVVAVAARPEEGFCWPLAAVAEAVRRWRPRLAFLCNPNNPTGVYLGREGVAAIARLMGDSLLVIDEAFAAFVQEPWDAVEMVGERPLVVLRSLTKDLALAGLRLGYLVASQEVVARVRPFVPTWSVNAAAQAAGLAALADGEHLRRSRAAVAEAKAYLTDALRRLGLAPLPSAANFLLVEVGEAAALRRRLLRRGLCLRDCASFGLPRYVRIAVRTLPECQRLIAALEEALHEG